MKKVLFPIEKNYSSTSLQSIYWFNWPYHLEEMPYNGLRVGYAACFGSSYWLGLMYWLNNLIISFKHWKTIHLSRQIVYNKVWRMRFCHYCNNQIILIVSTIKTILNKITIIIFFIVLSFELNYFFYIVVIRFMQLNNFHLFSDSYLVCYE